MFYKFLTKIKINSSKNFFPAAPKFYKKRSRNCCTQNIFESFFADPIGRIARYYKFFPHLVKKKFSLRTPNFLANPIKKKVGIAVHKIYSRVFSRTPLIELLGIIKFFNILQIFFKKMKILICS